MCDPKGLGVILTIWVYLSTENFFEIYLIRIEKLGCFFYQFATA